MSTGDFSMTGFADVRGVRGSTAGRSARETRIDDNDSLHMPLPPLENYISDTANDKKSPPACESDGVIHCIKMYDEILMMFSFYLAGAVCCTIFSMSGIIFLLCVATALKSDTIYLVMEDEDKAKHTFAPAVMGGMWIYVATMCISALFWVRTYTAPEVKKNIPRKSPSIEMRQSLESRPPNQSALATATQDRT